MACVALKVPRSLVFNQNALNKRYAACLYKTIEVRENRALHRRMFGRRHNTSNKMRPKAVSKSDDFSTRAQNTLALDPPFLRPM
jgi:hypothetical protein